MLTALGVDLRRTGLSLATAGDVYREGASAFSVATYSARMREDVKVTTSSSSKLFDLFTVAAGDIIANLDRPACPGVPMFDGNRCNPDGVSCLLGVSASPQHLSLCNLTVERDAGRRH
jgi:hypothetical protein